MQLAAQIDTAVSAIREKTACTPEIGLILGSGLGDYAQRIQNAVSIAYRDIPGMPVSTVEGHEGRFVLGEHLGRRVIAMQGRVHLYEGYTPCEVTLPVRLMHRLGARRLLLTNAAGGINTDFAVGTLMLITDHINYAGQNPLTGPNLDSCGPRFPDMTAVYDPALRAALLEAARGAGIPLVQGVYIMFSGPSYETPAEIRMARVMGADAVGMSTVPEAIVARHCGMQVLGISCITNPAAGVLDAPLVHAEVMETAARVKDQFVRLVDLALAQVL